MKITLDVPETLASALASEAARTGQSVEAYALRVLSRGVPADQPGVPRTGAELLAYWNREGLLGTRADIDDSVRHARELRERTQRRNHYREP